MPELRSSGDVVEHQSFLNGTRYYLLEGAGEMLGRTWQWTLSFTLPRDEGEPVIEGDLSVDSDASAWYGSVADGTHTENIDEDTGGDVVQVRLRVQRLSEAESTEHWAGADASLQILNSGCDLELVLR